MNPPWSSNYWNVDAFLSTVCSTGQKKSSIFDLLLNFQSLSDKPSGVAVAMTTEMIISHPVKKLVIFWPNENVPWNQLCTGETQGKKSCLLHYNPRPLLPLIRLTQQTAVQKVLSRCTADLGHRCHRGRLTEERGSARGRGRKLALWY